MWFYGCMLDTMFITGLLPLLKGLTLVVSHYAPPLHYSRHFGCEQRDKASTPELWTKSNNLSFK